MPFEIEMLSVGNADAIILRYLDKDEREYVVLIDAGNEGDGPKIEKHIKRYTDKKSIDLAICTHPDDDHIGGFPYVVKNIKIEKFWIHDPSKHLIRTKAILESRLSDYFEKSLKNLFESLTDSVNLLALIDRYKIDRSDEPFSGLSFSTFGIPLSVVGPTVKFYEEQLDGFRNIDKLYESIEKERIANDDELLKQIDIINKGFLISPSNDYTKENNSSVLLLFEPDEGKYLFAADAGPKALKLAKQDYDLSNVNWLKVPHHGSKYNISNALIDHFNPKTAYISCTRDKQYPDEMVVGHLKSKGCKVYSTCDGKNIVHRVGIPLRNGYSIAKKL